MTIPTALSFEFFHPQIKEGIIVGCDSSQEWLLPWWWSRYSEHNGTPVTFIDFGMSEKAQKFCRDLGDLISVHDSMDFISCKDDVSSEVAAVWEAIYKARVWDYRKGWFKKPFAMLLSPYKKTVWLDLDCEVLTSLSSLFKECADLESIAIAREPEHLQTLLREQGLLYEDEVLYNSGVIVFQQGAELIEEWVCKTIANNSEFVGDQNLISRIIHQKKSTILELPAIYNWRIFANNEPSHVIVHPETAIIHWASDWGKEYIRKYGGLGKDFRKFLRKI
jgi:hypothetical protein